MSKCGDCKYFTDKGKYQKGECSYHNWMIYSDEDACSHFVESSSGGCYLTSACCDYMGLPDDCRELTIMRKYRDEYLVHKEFGKELITTYYRDAPGIVAAIDRSSHRDSTYQRIYAVIQRIVSHLENGDNEDAGMLYMQMMYDLNKAYGM